MTVFSGSQVDLWPEFIELYTYESLILLNLNIQLKSIRLLIWLTVLLLVTIILEFEMPALKNWNPFDPNTPSTSRPRIGF